MGLLTSVIGFAFWLTLIKGEVTTDVHLFGGRTPYSGRLEIKRDGDWGTVCDDGFDNASAKVVCRMMGFTDVRHARFIPPSVYGPGTGTIWLDDIKCFGNETDIADCQHSEWGKSDCNHDEDISVDCQTPTRLFGGNAHKGRVELQIDGEWNSLCNDSFRTAEAKVVCSMLGFSASGAELFSSSSSQSIVSTTSYVCKGEEQDLSMCNMVETNCSSSISAGINCKTPIRLVNGTGPQSGRVELQYRGQWGTICDDNFDDLEAKVICNMLGLSGKNAKAHIGAYYGEGQGDIVVDELRCSGIEVDISECKSKDWLSPTNCNHNEDAAVECFSELRLQDGPANFVGRLEILNKTSWETLCSDSVDNHTALVVCNTLGFERGNISVYTDGRYGNGTRKQFGYQCVGNETDIANCKYTDVADSCTSDVGINCFSRSPVRVKGGPTFMSGYVEVYLNGQWYGIREHSFRKEDAMVLCTSLGFPTENPSFRRAYNRYAFVNPGRCFGSLGCHGNETDITECIPTGGKWYSGSCNSDYDYVGINCGRNTMYRLVDGHSIKSGRVEALYNGTWLGICTNNYFTTFEANMICNKVGFTQSGYLLSPISSKTAPVIYDLRCDKTEEDFSDCKSNIWGQNIYCAHIQISCNSTVRLVNGTSERSGRVEVHHQGQWGTLCADDFDNDDADVVCRKAGIRLWNASVLPDSLFGTGNSSTIINSTSCTGEEWDLSACSTSPWQETMCNGTEVATVQCGVLYSPIRLVGGKTDFDGEVQIYHQNSWSKIGSFSSKTNADLICSLLRYNFSSDALPSSKYYSSTTSYLLDNLYCNGNEAAISLCPSSDWGNHRSSGWSSAVVNCLSPIELKGGLTSYMGYVKLRNNRKDGYLCAEDLSPENEVVMCNMLSFSYAQQHVISGIDVFKPSFSTPVYVKNMTCDGDEKDFQLCQSAESQTISSCASGKYAFVRCNTPVQLVEQINNYTGTVEVHSNGAWNRICYSKINIININNANVLCFMMGFSSRSAKVWNTSLNEDQSTIAVNCNGRENDVSACIVSNSTCSEVLAISCPTFMEIRNGRTSYMGHIMVDIGRSQDYVYSVDAPRTIMAVCKMLNMSFTSERNIFVPTTNSNLRDQTNRRQIDRIYQLKCEGNESDIIECANSTTEDATYRYTNYGINCQTPIRLVDGSNHIHGTLQTKINNTWYRVCSDGFGENDAIVICRMSGHYHARNATFSTKESNDSSILGDWKCNGDEVDVSQCADYSESVETCSSRKIIQVDCRALVRIVDGPSPTKGRVEVFYGGHWGPICRSTTSSYVANVICRSAGYRYTYGTIKNFNTYTNKTFDNYTITNLVCTGYEDELTECKSNEWTLGSCRYSYPLEIECKTTVELVSGVNKYFGRVRLIFRDIYRNSYGSVCADNFDSNDADAICGFVGAPTNGSALIFANKKFGTEGGYVIENLECNGNETDIQECKSLPWFSRKQTCNSSNVSVSINCRPYTPIRLSGGSNSTGTVEAFYDGSWRTFCSSNFGYKEAAVICRRLNFKVGEPLSYYGNGFIYNLRCTGTESDITECGNPNYWGHYTCSSGSRERAGVQCSNNRVRLQNGINRYQGRVEFQYYGVWGTVCKHFDKYDAEVICRLALVPGNQTATIYEYSKYGTGSGSLVVEDLNCTGTEEDLDECGSFPCWSKCSASPSCNSHYYDVGVNCRPNTPIRLINGTNATKYSGRVEIEYEGRWGPICDRSFDANDAKVICRMLGLNTESASYHGNAFFGTGNNRAIISNLVCQGHEQDISECNAGYKWSDIHPYCSAVNNLAVQCNTPVRVNNAWTLYLGVVEVYIRGSWRGVCKDNFTKYDATTICNIAGLRDNYTGDVEVYDASRFGFSHSYTSTLLGGFNCTGYEDDLFFCGNGEWIQDNNDCPSGIYVAVNCRADTPIALKRNGHDMSNSIQVDKGLVEIQYRKYQDGKYQPHWGTICDDNFGDNDALVLCSMMGFDYGRVDRSPDIMEDYKPGDILIDELECIGSENDVSECPASQWSTHDCNHDEDVYIKCDYSTGIDPCSKEVYKRLPSLEMRVLNFKATAKPIDDSKLSPGWYFVGNNTLLNEEPPFNRCGTHFPIFTQGDPIFNGTVKAIVNGNPKEDFNVTVHQCAIGFVYKLEPTPVPQSAYCFGIGSDVPPPAFVAGTVGTILKYAERALWFQCKFDPDEENDFFYQVQWTIVENSEHHLTKQYCATGDLSPCFLTNDDLEELNVGMGTNISCAVRAFNEPGGQPGQLSQFSRPYFVGITLLTPSLTLRRGETKAIEFELSIPIVCDLPPGLPCKLTLDYFTPDYGTCPDAEASFPDGCRLMVNSNVTNSRHHVNVSAAETGNYGVAGKFTLHLQALRAKGIIFLWKTYKLPSIKVDVLPETDRNWRGKICSARNDPHMYTFDGRAYEHHSDEGDYTLYSHLIFKEAEIQHKIAYCTNSNNPAKCNCGLAVRAGRDVYVINVCNGYIDIGYKQCWDKALTVKKENDFTYTIYMPYGTAVRARIDNAPFMGDEGGRVLDISVLPSVQDRQGNSTGLCGSLNDNSADDFDSETEFINEWKVPQDRSLFTTDVYHRELPPWEFPLCVCKKNGGANAYSCEKSTSGCSNGRTTGYHSCGEIMNQRSVRSLHRRPKIPIVKIPIHSRGKRAATQTFTPKQATTVCEGNFENSSTFGRCKNLPSTHTNISMDNCIKDVLLMNNTEWASIARQSMQETCKTAVSRNESVVEEIIKTKENELKNETNSVNNAHLQEELNALKEVQQHVETVKLQCMNDCSGNGNCHLGACQCNKGFGGSACSLDLNIPPLLSGLLDEGLCDEDKNDCTNIFVFGGIFSGNNITCKMDRFIVDINGTDHDDGSAIVPGQTESIIETVCPVGFTRRARSSDEGPHKFIQGMRVSVSNDGENFSNDSKMFYIYNSKCQAYNRDNGSEVEFTFELKQGHCYIAGQCYYNGTMHSSLQLRCDPTLSTTGWTFTTVSSSPIAPVKDCNDSNTCVDMNNTVCTMKYKSTDCECVRGFKTNDNGTCVASNDLSVTEILANVPEKFDKHRASIRLDYQIRPVENLDSAKTYNAYEDELTVQLEAQFRQKLGIGLEKIVIVSISEGSLIIEFVMVTSKDEFVEKALSVALVELSQSASFKVFNTPANILRVGVGDQDVDVTNENSVINDLILCSAFTALKPCQRDFECEVVDGTPTCRSLESLSDELLKGTSLIVLIVSTSAGVLLLFVILVLVVVVCKRQNKKRHNQPIGSLEPKHKDNVYRDVHDIALQTLRQESESCKIPRPMLSGSQLAFEKGIKDSTHTYEGTVYNRSRHATDGDRYEYLPVDDRGSYYNEGFCN